MLKRLYGVPLIPFINLGFFISLFINLHRLVVKNLILREKKREKRNVLEKITIPCVH
jgi:hypothetical protein